MAVKAEPASHGDRKRHKTNPLAVKDEQVSHWHVADGNAANTPQADTASSAAAASSAVTAVSRTQASSHRLNSKTSKSCLTLPSPSRSPTGPRIPVAPLVASSRRWAWISPSLRTAAQPPQPPAGAYLNTGGQQADTATPIPLIDPASRGDCGDSVGQEWMGKSSYAKRVSNSFAVQKKNI